jgi:hypothetical protein
MNNFVNYSSKHTNFRTRIFLFTLYKIFVIFSEFICSVVLTFIEFILWLLIINQNTLIFLFLFLFLFCRKHIYYWYVLNKCILLEWRSNLKLNLISLTKQKLLYWLTFLSTIQHIFNILKSIGQCVRITLNLFFYIDNHLINLNYFIINQRRYIK